MSEHRRRSPGSGGGEQPQDGQPYAYGSPVEGAPIYGRPGPDELRSEGPRRATRQTAQQPRPTRAEMRKQGQRGSGSGSGGGGRRGGPPPGRGGKPGKKRFIDYPRHGKTGFRRWVPSWKLVTSLFLIFFGSGVAAVGVAYAMTPVPNAKDLTTNQNNIYYWADGSEMVHVGNANGSKQYVALSEISRPAQDAVIAAENETFRTDSGIDPKGIARAIYNMASGGATQGGSTITQQYVKNAYLSQDQTITRKLKEFFITLKINGNQTKDQILEGYLNISWFGHGATGIQAAAQAYYGVDAKDLNVCQSAMLAGLLKGAAYYDPTLSQANKDNMQGRWEYVLNRMVVNKFITQADRDACGKTFPAPVAKSKAQANMTGQTGYLVDTANKDLIAKGISEAQIGRGGLKIYTTFEKPKVDALSKAVNDVFSQNIDPKKRPDTDQFVQAAAASIVPGDGRIVAIYGGPGFDQGQYINAAAASGVPVGSTWKPIDLAAAMKYGVRTKKDTSGGATPISTDTRYLADDNTIIKNPDGTPVLGPDGKPFHQHNDETGAQGYVTIKEAMTRSFNVPFVQLGEDVGANTVKKMAVELGAASAPTDKSLAASNASFFIGTSTPSPIKMAGVYGVFAARGMKVDPYSVIKVVDAHSKTMPGFDRPAPTQVLDQAIADNITDVLQSVINDPNGTGVKAKALGRPAAGKTGTTDEYRSAWFDGYTPQLATTVSMYREDPKNQGLLSLKGTAGLAGFYGGVLPTKIWTEYMTAALDGTQAQDFPTAAPVGTNADQSGAPSTASPSASASVSPSAAPTAPVPSASDVKPSATDTPTGLPSPSDTSGQPCIPVLGSCPTTTPTKHTKPPTTPPTTTPPPPPPGQ